MIKTTVWARGRKQLVGLAPYMQRRINRRMSLSSKDGQPVTHPSRWQISDFCRNQMYPKFQLSAITEFLEVLNELSRLAFRRQYYRSWKSSSLTEVRDEGSLIRLRFWAKYAEMPIFKEFCYFIEKSKVIISSMRNSYVLLRNECSIYGQNIRFLPITNRKRWAKKLGAFLLVHPVYGKYCAVEGNEYLSIVF